MAQSRAERESVYLCEAFAVGETALAAIVFSPLSNSCAAGFATFPEGPDFPSISIMGLMLDIMLGSFAISSGFARREESISPEGAVEVLCDALSAEVLWAAGSCGEPEGLDDSFESSSLSMLFCRASSEEFVLISELLIASKSFFAVFVVLYELGSAGYIAVSSHSERST